MVGTLISSSVAKHLPQALSLITMIIYAAVTLGRFDIVHSKALLGLSIVAVVVMSLGSAFGLVSYLGLSFTSLTPMAAFIVLGIGKPSIAQYHFSLPSATGVVSITLDWDFTQDTYK